MVTDEGRWWASLLYHASRVLQHLVIELSLGLLDTITSVQVHNRICHLSMNGTMHYYNSNNYKTLKFIGQE